MREAGLPVDETLASAQVNKCFLANTRRSGTGIILLAGSI